MADADDAFISEVNRVTLDELVTLFDSKLINQKDAEVRFLALSLSLDPDTTDEEIYDALTEYNWHPELVSVVAELGKTAIIETMRFLDKWNFMDYNGVFIRAAREGRIDVMTVLKDWGWGVKYLNGAMTAAVETGQTEAMTLLRQWGVGHADSFLSTAARFGRVEAMLLLKHWGDVDFESSMFLAAGKGQPDAMEEDLRRLWKTQHYCKALCSAAENDQLKAMAVIKDWDVNPRDLEAAFVSAAKKGRKEAMILLRSWGVTNYKKALTVAWYKGTEESNNLLREWMRM